jgi:AraC-like DNA-binding protein
MDGPIVAGDDRLFIVFTDRQSDSPFIERVWRSHSERAGRFHSIAACHWEMVVTRHNGKTSLTIRGPETKATTADCPALGEWFAIRFKLGSFMPMLRPGALRDRKTVTLPDESGRSFWLNGSKWEYPNFENAETFVRRLACAGLIAIDNSVLDALHSSPQKLSRRTAQRHLLHATGVTYSTIRQIERARYATNLLKQGSDICGAIHEAGYYDQAHLTRSLNRFIGQTPAQILRAKSQLSFLYNTALT